jgi:hypothetical protein
VPQIPAPGSRVSEGSYRMDGIKSDLRAELRWHLARRLNYAGPNTLTVEWRLVESADGRIRENGRERFDLSTGRMVP